MGYSYKGGFDNNLDFLRLVLATSVVFLHFDHLVNSESVSSVFKYAEFLSSRAVESFFVISGFVVYMSYDRKPRFPTYLINRILRIYPVYIVLILLCSFGLFFVSGSNVSEYFTEDFYRYNFYNLLFLNFMQPTLPGVFEGNFDTVVNGSLWTLKIEVAFYFCVPLIYLMIKRYGAPAICLAGYALSVFYIILCQHFKVKYGNDLFVTLENQLPGQLVYFFSGILAYCYYEYLKKYITFFLVGSFFVFSFGMDLLEPIAVCVVLVFFFVMTSFRIDLSKMGDISYGVYIFHFPLIQILVFLEVLENFPFLLFSVVLIGTMMLAYISHQLIEVPALKLKKKVFSQFGDKR